MPHHRAPVVLGAAGVVMAVLVLAASSGSVQLWTNPSPAVQAVDDPGPVEPTELPTRESRDRRPAPWVGGAFNVVGGVVIGLLFAGGAVLALSQLRPATRVVRFGRRRRVPRDAGQAPELLARPLEVDAEAAEAALSTGAPRNAIVGCWMQLERDAAAMGLSRLAAETATDYVERVVGLSSVDPAPIAELASLYREARFSHHQLTPDHRARAASALADVVVGLEPLAGVST